MKFYKNCKKCSFSPPKMKVLGLHIENDHQYEFQCSNCNNNYHFKNRLKTHKREVHYKATFVCLVCDEKFRTHKKLQQQIQKQSMTSAPKQIVHKHNDEMHKENEHKCPMCPKITNKQVSLAQHVKQSISHREQVWLLWTRVWKQRDSNRACSAHPQRR